MVKSFLQFSIFLLLASPVVGQEDFLEFFRVIQREDDVVLNWVISKGNTCNGIDILRSSDSLNFTAIGQIEGICGDEEESVSYVFVDNDPLSAGRSFYRLELGAVGSSEIKGLDFIDLTDQSYVVRPNPVVNQGRVYFKPSDTQTHYMYLFDIQGKISAEIPSSGMYFELQNKGYQSGLYVFIIENREGKRITSGRLIFN